MVGEASLSSEVPVMTVAVLGSHHCGIQRRGLRDAPPACCGFLALTCMLRVLFGDACVLKRTSRGRKAKVNVTQHQAGGSTAPLPSPSPASFASRKRSPSEHPDFSHKHVDADLIPFLFSPWKRLHSRALPSCPSVYYKQEEVRYFFSPLQRTWEH